MDDFKYRAFISYSHDDEKVASWFHRYLERYRIPSEIVVENNLPSSRLKPIFRDKEELSTSSNLGAEIRLALEQSESMIVICSKAAQQSKWVNEEVTSFCRLNRADRIHCIVVEGKPPGIFPAVLLKKDTEPLAVDIRPGGVLRKYGTHSDLEIRLRWPPIRGPEMLHHQVVIHSERFLHTTTDEFKRQRFIGRSLTSKPTLDQFPKGFDFAGGA